MSNGPLSQYDYQVPQELVATKPAMPRDSARLFVYDTRTDTIAYDTVANLAHYLSKGDLMVFNDTKVVPARVSVSRDGVRFEALLLVNERTDDPSVVKLIVNKRTKIGDVLLIDERHTVTVIGQDENIFFATLNFAPEELPEVLQHAGRTPTPGYLGVLDMSEEEIRERYQSMFAREGTSVAAPTASLHFTDTLVNSLAQKGIEREYVTLHVGLGTFQNVRTKQLEEGKLHVEPFTIPKRTAEVVCSRITDPAVRVVAVGTTVVRTLESAAGGLCMPPHEVSGETDIFIRPPYHFNNIDTLMTNFHVPCSSLMCLVDAFLHNKGAKRGIVELYEDAVREKFRFFSFGDAMLIL